VAVPHRIRSLLASPVVELIGKEKIQSILVIPELIQNGIYLESDKAHNPDQIKMTSHFFAAKVEIDGKAITVGFVIKEDTNGKRFYDHELTEINHLDDTQTEAISKKKLLDAQYRQGDVMDIVRKHLGVNLSLHQSAFHGSGKKFRKFLLSKIDTGSGLQSFGWGLYFADSRDMAEAYTRVLDFTKGNYILDTLK